MINEIVSSILFKSIGRLFPYLQRKIYSKQEFERDIEIYVGSTDPISNHVSFSLNSEIPFANIYLKVDNKSQYLDVMLRISLTSLRLKHDKYSQQIIKEIRNFPEVQIKPKGTGYLCYTVELNESQINYLNKIKDNKELSAEIYLKVDIASSLYQIKEKPFYLENKPCKIEV